MMQEGALTLFALYEYDLYRTNTAHGQRMTSEIRSGIDNSITVPA